ncbi:uncharacterized protein [Anabrus simplex]|uniref:uncharacterized protein n=1 Tax=Anabrus simplex TaxID=316456 RepID=UPI0034DCF127
MSPRSLLLVLLHCFLVVSVLDAAATKKKKLDGSCRNITPPQGFTLTSMVGDWYVSRTVGRDVNEDSTTECLQLRYSKVNGTTILAENTKKNQQGYFIVLDVNKPWILSTVDRDSTMMIIYVSPDKSKMVTTFCLPNSIGKGYFLFTKQTPVSNDDVTAVENIVDGAGGIRNSTSEQYHTWQSAATCSKK